MRTYLVYNIDISCIIYALHNNNVLPGDFNASIQFGLPLLGLKRLLSGGCIFNNNNNVVLCIIGIIIIRNRIRIYILYNIISVCTYSLLYFPVEKITWFRIYLYKPS